jgi:hypothetical protein
VIAMIVVGFGTAFGLLAYELSNINLSLGDGNMSLFGARQLHPVPVPREACTTLVPVRQATNHLANFWNRALVHEDTWRAHKARLRPELGVLEVRAKLAEPNVPTVIRTRLDLLAAELDRGRGDLPRASDMMVYITTASFARGMRALEEVSNLVGSACGAPLYSGFPVA